MTTDQEAEDFLEQDLSGLDFRQFKPAHFITRDRETFLWAWHAHFDT